MKVIFLDIDGVVTSVRTGWYNMDIYIIHFLNWVCRKADAKIVISSTWRHNHDAEFWETVFPGNVHDDYKTKDIVLDEETGIIQTSRGYEVEDWLNRHKEVDDYMIIDDDSDFLPDQMHRLIHTCSLDGMLSEHMTKILDFWAIKGYPAADDKIIQHNNMFVATRLTKLKNGT